MAVRKVHWLRRIGMPESAAENDIRNSRSNVEGQVSDSGPCRQDVEMSDAHHLLSFLPDASRRTSFRESTV